MEFPTTHWTLLAVATLHGDSNANEALAEFYRRYRQPVIAFIHRRGVRPHEAEALAQDFILHLMPVAAIPIENWTRACISPDRRLVAVPKTADENVSIHNADTGSVVATLPAEHRSAVAFSPDGR